jgi:hypothetical protein
MFFHFKLRAFLTVDKHVIYVDMDVSRSLVACILFLSLKPKVPGAFMGLPLDHNLGFIDLSPGR